MYGLKLTPIQSQILSEQTYWPVYRQRLLAAALHIPEPADLREVFPVTELEGHLLTSEEKELVLRQHGTDQYPKFYSTKRSRKNPWWYAVMVDILWDEAGVMASLDSAQL